MKAIQAAVNSQLAAVATGEETWRRLNLLVEAERIATMYTAIRAPRAERIRVVLDNLSTHTPSALYEAFEPEEARRILRRLELHYTPKYASWLNMVEIEIGVMARQCLDCRIPTLAILTKR